jgi:hypothetical protein
MSLMDSSEGDTWVSFRWFPDGASLRNSNRTQRLMERAAWFKKSMSAYQV